MFGPRSQKTSDIKVLFCGLALGCVLVTLLASRSLVGTGAAVAQQIRQPRRGLQGSVEASEDSGVARVLTGADTDSHEARAYRRPACMQLRK